MVYRFEEFEVDDREFRLSEGGTPVQVEPKVLRLLVCLIENRNRLVRKQELLDKVWPDAIVTENALTRAIGLLRKALNEDSHVPRFIETVPTAGYRFIANVAVAEGGSVDEPVTQTKTAPDPASWEGGFRAPKRWILAGVLVVLAAAGGEAFLFRRPSPAPLPPSPRWEQLTFFTDSAVYPTLSSDGRILAFVKGTSSFIGPGEIFVKLLPGGEPVQLTHDSKLKLAPAFSPDNSRISYGVPNPWDTWEVPVLGGEPHLLLPNASSLTWIDGGKRLLFSEIIEGLHLKVVTTDEARGNSRDVYVPEGKRSMAHHSYLSPDGRLVLIVEMDNHGDMAPCRVVRFQGTPDVRVVGPPNNKCLAGAWSPDGKWIYLTLAMKTDDYYHIWRQRFPEGSPEQLTFGPGSQEGTAMAPDGKSFITSVGAQEHTVWLHDKDGEHQMSSEGDALAPTLSWDGRSLYFLMSNGQTQGVELWVKDLDSGKVDKVVPGYNPIRGQGAYSLSQDGKKVAFAMDDQSGRSSLWVAATNHRSSPQHLSSASAEDTPLFLADGDLLFRAIEGGSNFLYRMKADGTGRRKIMPDRILDLMAVSPEGRWVVASVPNSDEEHTLAVKAFAMDGSASTLLCVTLCYSKWDLTGKFVYLTLANDRSGNSYVLPVMPDVGLPKLPSAGIATADDLANAKTIPHQLGSALDPSVYVYMQQYTRRNLYRIQLP